MNVAVVVPTFNAGSIWGAWIEALTQTGFSANDVYIVDSSSSDDTILLSKRAGFNVKEIARGTFNHGGTRQQALNGLENYEIVIFLTQDAVLTSVNSISNLISPFDSAQVSAVCGRQLPRSVAGEIETHARLFNYSNLSVINTIKDAKKKGLKAAFISNSFAAYRISALREVGGFPKDVIFGEDMYVAAKMLLKNYSVAYAADACVHHSHGYSIMQEVRRYFDMGVFHAREPWIRRELGGVEGEGIKFVASELKYLQKHAFWLMPEALFRTLFRYAGFRLGLAEKKLPLCLKRKLAMNKGYFISQAASSFK